MAKHIQFFTEAKVELGRMADEATGNPTGEIEATLTTWGAREGVDGRRFFYRPEAFEMWHEGWMEAGRPLPMYFQHSSDMMPVGEWSKFDITDEGMTGTGKLFLNTTAGSDLYTIMKESPRMVGGVSVGAYADEYQMVDENGEPTDDPDSFFQIMKGGLAEVSIVMNPNNPKAEISRLEYWMDNKPNPRVIEKALRDAGLSRKDATAASALLKQIIEQRDAESAKQPANLGEPDAAVKLLEALQYRELLKAIATR